MGLLAGKTVLLVEDEIMVAMLAEMMLLDLGAARVVMVHTLGDGLAALEEREAPDLAVLDVNLRGERSFPIARTLEARGTPFIYATAYGSTVAGEGPEAPIVTKPYDEAQLRDALAGLVVTP